MAQVALNWCTSRTNVIVIPKPNSVTRTEELYRIGLASVSGAGPDSGRSLRLVSPAGVNPTLKLTNHGGHARVATGLSTYAYVSNSGILPFPGFASHKSRS